MNRRDFLKFGGALSVALLLQASPLSRTLGFSSTVEAKGKLYRGTKDGKIYASADNGKTWDQMVNFGPDFIIYRVATDLRGQVYARLRYTGRSFELRLSKDSREWRTD